MKRTLALVLAILMVIGLFAGCQKNTPAPTETEKPGTTESKDTKPVETKPAETTAPAEIPTIHWYTVGNGSAPNQDTWAEKMNAYLEEKIGVHLDLQIVPWGDYDKRISNMIATNEYFDICFGNRGNFRKHVNMNAFMDLTPYIDNYAALQEAIPDALWTATTINGGLYGVPTYKDNGPVIYWHVRQDFAEKYLPNYADCHDLNDFTEALKALKADTGKTPVVTGGFDLPLPFYDDLTLGVPCYGVNMYAEGSPKIVEVYRDEKGAAELAKMHSWIEQGLMNDDGAVRKDIKAEETVLGMGAGWPSAWVGRVPPIVTTYYATPYMNNGSCLGSINHISSSCKYPEAALKLLEIVNTDTWVRDCFCYGEEGVNFEYVEVDGEKRIHKLNTDWGGANYTQGQFFIETPLDTVKGNPMVNEVLVQNEAAHLSPCLGFFPDTTNVQDKLDEMHGILAEFDKLIKSTGDPEIIDELYARMDEVGAKEVIAELQTQLDAWWAAKNA